jgi:FKBP-type peptidyl-prolyl cis-trans isomerase
MNRRFALMLTLLAVFVAASGCGSSNKSSAPSTSSPIKVSGQPTTTPSGLQYWDIVAGTGATATPGSMVKVHYSGFLTSGQKFDSSRDRGEPFSFPLGGGQVIKGWDEGVAGMKVGGQRQLKIPPDLGYGATGAGGVIPPNATLIFDVELLDVSK